MPRFNLPEIEFLTKDVEEIETTVINRFEELRGKTLVEADPRRKLVQAFAYAMGLHRNYVDYSLKQRLLAYAQDDFLDHLGQNELTPRLEPKAAGAIFRFELNVPPGESAVIAKDTYIKANGTEVMFATKEDAVITEGMTYIDIPADCTESGTIGNGFLPNQVNQLVKPLPWVTKVYNLTKTDGGADWESNDSYAERIRLSGESYSTAGAEEAYIFHAKSANQLIVDVKIRHPEEGTIEIIPLLGNGEIPNETVLTQVLEACSDKKVRPMTDRVIASAPPQIEYDIDVTYYIPTNQATLSESIQAAVLKSVDDYKLWQKSKLGRGIDPSELIARMRGAGATRINAGAPLFQELEDHQVAKERNVNIVFGGFANA